MRRILSVICVMLMLAICLPAFSQPIPPPSVRLNCGWDFFNPTTCGLVCEDMDGDPDTRFDSYCLEPYSLEVCCWDGTGTCCGEAYQCEYCNCLLGWANGGL